MLPQVPIIRVTDAEKIPLPSYSDGVGTCLTLRSNEMKSVKIAPKQFEVFSTGFAIALPIGMEAQIRSLKESTKTGVIVLNAPATIDASDRKEIKVCIYNASQESVIIKQGDPIALMVFSLALRIQWASPAKRQSDEVKSDITSQPDMPPFVPLKEYAFQTNDSKITLPQTNEINPPGIIQPVTRPNLPDEMENETIPDENPLTEEVVTPPDILEEFEKIESEFEDNQTEGTD